MPCWWTWLAKTKASPSSKSEKSDLANPGRDATALTVVEVDLSSLADELIKAPTYRVVDRRQWVGVKHSSLYGKILALYELWKARYLVIDATGVGAGLASFLEKSLSDQVIRFEFNSITKSQLGWDFLSIIESGRFKDWNTSSRRQPGMSSGSSCSSSRCARWRSPRVRSGA